MDVNLRPEQPPAQRSEAPSWAQPISTQHCSCPRPAAPRLRVVLRPLLLSCAFVFGWDGTPGAGASEFNHREKLITVLHLLPPGRLPLNNTGPFCHQQYNTRCAIKPFFPFFSRRQTASSLRSAASSAGDATPELWSVAASLPQECSVCRLLFN